MAERRYALIGHSHGDSGGAATWVQTALELANSITPTDTGYEPGNVLRYGAVADSTTDTAGTDCTSAFQQAVDSGHNVFVPPGWYNLASTVKIWGGSSEEGGKTFIASSGARMESFSVASSNEPILWIQGTQNFVDLQGGIVAARLGSGFTKGLVLVGQDPTETDPTSADNIGAMYYNNIGNMKIIGKTANTTKDKTVGFMVNSNKHKRGGWTDGTSPATPVYYNSFFNITSQQVDMPFHVSMEANFNSFSGCTSKNFGRAGWSINGYGNMFFGCRCETPVSWDTVTPISSITIGSPTTITTSAAHSLSTGMLVKLSSITDSGAGTLESALNTNRFEVTVVSTTQFTIALDTTGLATYSSGGSASWERYTVYLGKKEDGFSCDLHSDESAATTTNPITGITKGNPTTITCVAHGLSSTDKVRIKDIVDTGPNGELEEALNGGHFQITSTGADTFTIPVDTSSTSETWSSGGTIYTDFLPFIGARVNKWEGSIEMTFGATTAWVRGVGYRDAVIGFDDPSTHTNTYDGMNEIYFTSTLPGGTGRDGLSTEIESVGYNIVETSAVALHRVRPMEIHGHTYGRLDDDSGAIIHSNSTALLNGRIAEATESYTYDLFHIDNVGGTSASVLIELDFMAKESVNQDHVGGKIIWLCPVTSSTAQEPIVLQRTIGDFGGEVPVVPIITESAGTTGSTGKFTVSMATQNVSGTGNNFISWSARVISSQLEGSNLDWRADLSYLSSSSSGVVTDDNWLVDTKIKSADESVTSSTLPQTDNHLVGWNLKAGAKYKFEAFLMLTQGGGGLRIKFEFSNTPAEYMVYIHGSRDSSGITTLAYCAAEPSPTATLSLTNIVGTTTAGVAVIQGFVEANATTGGTVDFKWAQSSSNATASTLDEGSYMTFTRLS